MAETAAEAQTVATPAHQSAVFVAALVADVVAAGVTAASAFSLDTLDAAVAVVLPAVSVVQAALPAVAVELPEPAAVTQAVVVPVVFVGIAE